VGDHQEDPQQAHAADTSHADDHGDHRIPCSSQGIGQDLDEGPHEVEKHKVVNDEKRVMDELCIVGEDPEGEGGDEPKLDEKFLDALEMAIDTQNISTSMVQTRLGLGYARAARIVGVMEQKGYIGSYDTATKARKILVTREELMEMRMNKADEENEG